MGASSTLVQPYLIASRVEGDDELPWPAERLLHNWPIPKVDEEYWSREQMPREVPIDVLVEQVPER